MRRRLIILAAILAVIAAGFLGWHAWYYSQDQIAGRCIPALHARPDGDKTRPGACDGLTDDNYSLLNIGDAFDRVGGLQGLLDGAK